MSTEKTATRTCDGPLCLGSVAPARIEVPRRVHPHEWKAEELAAWYRWRGWRFPGRCPDCSRGWPSKYPVNPARAENG